MTTLTQRDGTSAQSHMVYALGPVASETGDQAALAGFIDSLDDLVDVAVEPYVPPTVVIRGLPAIDSAPGSLAVVDWPPSGPQLSGTAGCIGVTDPATIAVLLAASTLTRFLAEGTTWQLAARPAVAGSPTTC